MLLPLLVLQNLLVLLLHSLQILLLPLWLSYCCCNGYYRCLLLVLLQFPLLRQVRCPRHPLPRTQSLHMRLPLLILLLLTRLLLPMLLLRLPLRCKATQPQLQRLVHLFYCSHRAAPSYCGSHCFLSLHQLLLADKRRPLLLGRRRTKKCQLRVALVMNPTATAGNRPSQQEAMDNST
jgi:hypothetical protein